ncbi:MAG: A24 family peptidase [Planctomycetes bacterium]|nr:A24 family peptidase [Planctomycetota bacterium]
MNIPLPGPWFGWSFFAVLLILLAFAAVIDFRTTRIPKRLTLTIAALGIVANIVRGLLLGSQNRETWQFGPGPAWVGALDGLTFSLLGLFFAFFLFFGMWMLGSCGGGDVKLCAAIGAWIGAIPTILLLFATVFTLMIWIAGRALYSGKTPALNQNKPARKVDKEGKKNELPRGRMTFSFPAMVATAIVVLFIFRVDLQLLPAPVK